MQSNCFWRKFLKYIYYKLLQLWKFKIQNQKLKKKKRGRTNIKKNRMEYI